MKNIVALGLVTLFVGSIGCAAESSDPDEGEKSERAASPLISGGGGGGGSGGLGYCGATVDCENKCADMYPKDASAQSLCKKIEKCSTKCADVGFVLH